MRVRRPMTNAARAARERGDRDEAQQNRSNVL
jgi:hypothetical protein